MTSLTGSHTYFCCLAPKFSFSKSPKPPLKHTPTPTHTHNHTHASSMMNVHEASMKKQLLGIAVFFFLKPTS